MYKDDKFNDIISNTKLKIKPMRDIYDRSMKYLYGSNPPIEINEDKINRVMVNYIRHSNSNYNISLKHIRNINDKKETYYHIYKNNVLNIIENEYPVLKKECNRQKTMLNMARIINIK